MRTQDMIVVLHGCRAPIALRALDERHYSIVGERYIHSCMNGEAVDQCHGTHGTHEAYMLK